MPIIFGMLAEVPDAYSSSARGPCSARSVRVGRRLTANTVELPRVREAEPGSQALARALI